MLRLDRFTGLGIRFESPFEVIEFHNGRGLTEGTYPSEFLSIYSAVTMRSYMPRIILCAEPAPVVGEGAYFTEINDCHSAEVEDDGLGHYFPLAGNYSRAGGRNRW